jgi:hypothetical protein
MIDRSTKALLAAIALGLWIQIAAPWLRPVALHAAPDSDLYKISFDLDLMKGFLHDIWNGNCVNPTLCPPR